MTTLAIEEDLFQFTKTLLERAGGVVDWSDPHAKGLAMMPPEIVARAQLPSEEFPLSTEGQSGFHVNLAGDFLDSAQRLLDASCARVGEFAIEDCYLKKGELKEALDQFYGWRNVRAMYQLPQPRNVVYESWAVHAKLQSDDVWEAMLRVSVNSLSGAEIELPDLLELPTLNPAPSSESASDRVDTEPIVLRLAKKKMLAASKEFIQRTEQRLERDRKRLRDYYRSLLRQDAAKTSRGDVRESVEADANRKRAVELELQRKLDELIERYTIRAELTPIAVVRCSVPALEIPVRIQRLKAIGTRNVYWNSLLRKFEPLICDQCGISTQCVSFTNETLETRCDECALGGDQSANRAMSRSANLGKK